MICCKRQDLFRVQGILEHVLSYVGPDAWLYVGPVSVRFEKKYRRLQARHASRNKRLWICMTAYHSCVESVNRLQIALDAGNVLCICVLLDRDAA